jgi:hypothetical protein
MAPRDREQHRLDLTRIAAVGGPDRDDDAANVVAESPVFHFFRDEVRRNQCGLGDLLTGISAVGEDALDEREDVPRDSQKRCATIGALSGVPAYVIRRLKGSRDSTHYVERDELSKLRRLPRQSAYVFVNERGQPFGRMGIARLIERAGEAAGLPFPVHVHMLRHACGYALANKGMDTRKLQHYLGHASITNTVRYSAMSPEPFRDLWR